MKKLILVCVGFILLIVLLLGYYNAFIREEPEYLVLEIPNPQYSSSSPYSNDEYAHSEEFSTFVWHDSGHHYYVWRMYLGLRLGDGRFYTIEDVEDYYDKQIKALGREETRNDDCYSYMKEFHPEKSYKAYVYPTKYYEQPIACLAVWLQDKEAHRLFVLIKTINPSRDVLSDWSDL